MYWLFENLCQGAASCRCNVGYGGVAGGKAYGTCAPCAAGKFKSVVGDGDCSPCAADVTCNTGFFVDECSPSRDRYIYIYMCVHVYVFMYVCMYVLYVYTYIRVHDCMYVYVHMFYVLIRPPIPYITSSRCKRLDKFRPVKILLHKRTNPRVPPWNDLDNNFFLNLWSNHFVFF